ncbi:MAG: hypothetical protein LBU42_01055 [Prevotellaceae bacterium]|nr:hypothetical protein [Prevotellaceae bacterium]
MNCSVWIKIAVAVFGLSACSPELTKGFRKAGKTVVAREDLYPFWTPPRTHLFTMKIDFRKDHFSGLLLVRQSDSAHFRMVFNTHFGMGVFDFEFRRDTFHVHSCLEMLQQKKVLSLLEKDFRSLFFLDVQPAHPAAVYRKPEDAALEINRIDGRYYLKNTAQKTLLKMETPHGFRSGHYDFSGYRERFPEAITIKHGGIGLQITLEKIHQPPDK